MPLTYFCKRNTVKGEVIGPSSEATSCTSVPNADSVRLDLFTGRIDHSIRTARRNLHIKCRSVDAELESEQINPVRLYSGKMRERPTESPCAEIGHNMLSESTSHLGSSHGFGHWFRLSRTFGKAGHAAYPHSVD